MQRLLWLGRGSEETRGSAGREVKKEICTFRSGKLFLVANFGAYAMFRQRKGCFNLPKYV